MRKNINSFFWFCFCFFLCVLITFKFSTIFNKSTLIVCGPFFSKFRYVFLFYNSRFWFFIPVAVCWMKTQIPRPSKNVFNFLIPSIHKPVQRTNERSQYRKQMNNFNNKKIITQTFTLILCRILTLGSTLKGNCN